MRWRSRDGPWGSHHVEARALKWAISSVLTDEKDEAGGVGKEEAVEVHRDGNAALAPVN